MLQSVKNLGLEIKILHCYFSACKYKRFAESPVLNWCKSLQLHNQFAFGKTNEPTLVPKGNKEGSILNKKMFQARS